MKLHGRIEKLERVVKALPRDCLACGYPGRRAIRVVETYHDGPMPTCHKCGVPLDFDGRPLGYVFKRIIRQPKEHS